MKQQTMKKIALLVLPLAACTIAATPGSVMVMRDGTAQAVSYMQIVQESAVGWCAPMAAIINYAVFAMAVLYALAKKNGFLKAVFGCAFASMTLAVLPVLARTEPMIVPNVFFALVLLAECVLAGLMLQNSKTGKMTQPAGPRLDVH